jgi:hypothetical protein
LNLLAETRTENRDGNPKFLDGIFRCIQLRCRLLGLLITEKPDNRGTVAQVLVVEPILNFNSPPPVLPPPVIDGGTNGPTSDGNGHANGADA